MSVSRALLFYRIMAYIVGVGLIVVFVCIPFQSVEKVVGFTHGMLYLVYLVSVLNLVARARLNLWTLLAMVACGWVPFLAFVVEHWITRRLKVTPDRVAPNTEGPPPLR
jgi:integral membrane protein